LCCGKQEQKHVNSLSDAPGKSTVRYPDPVMLLSLLAATQQAALMTPPVEFGAVAWERDFPAARERAQREGKSLLVLFQEVPG
jgi:hypothetical protein